MQARNLPLIIAMVVTLVLHVMLAGGLYAAGILVANRKPPPPLIEIEIAPPPKPQPKKVELPRPPPEPPPEPAKPVEPEKPRPQPKVAREVRRAPPPPPVTPEPPAPGPNTNDDAPAPVVSIPDLSVSGGSVPVAVGRPTTRKVGTGGDGTNTGGGGPPESKGSGPPRPVSVAAIKTRAMPLNADLDAGKLYPAEAKRLGVEGKVKVKLVVDETGQVISRLLVTRLGHGLDELALQLAKRLRFEPAVDTDDRRVQSVVVWTFDFVLPR